MQQMMSTIPSPTYTNESSHLICLHRLNSGIFSGTIPLHWSSGQGHLDVCQFLVEKRADVNAADNRYDTQPYTYAYDYLFCL
jgi:hypothetical protein